MWRRVSVPFPPGEYLQEFMEGKGWTRDDLAFELGQSRAHIDRLISGKARITVKIAFTLAGAFDTSAELWVKLQMYYDQNRPKAGKGRNDERS